MVSLYTRGVPLAWFSIALVAASLAWRTGRTEGNVARGSFNLACLLALLANGCGIFSNPNDRYQSRLVWLAPLAAFLTIQRAPAGQQQI